MNIYILTDMEGISLVTEWDQVKQGSPRYEQYRTILTEEVNAAVEGAMAAGATRIVINDGHGSPDYNLLWERMHPSVEIERPDSAANVLPSLDESFHSMLLIGYHAMEGTPYAVMPHTQSHLRVSYYEINDRRIGEIGQMALIAGASGVPVAYISGDRAAVDEARQFCGENLPGTVVKWGHSHGRARSLHPGEATRRIRQEVEEALKQPRREPLLMESPYTVTIGLKAEEYAEQQASLPGIKRVDAFTVSRTVTSAKRILG
ncbi:M55 family metallopeptidase [Paenibacillus sp. J2TS4]|uniref:M55 family metallopeptidase n=1 Tax=Paenibacillus sp. J2TS4 TaxID=2807194 RepID=UPI001B1DC116|nr:M55 family metallopeptidase [Paenibacillus sp. J2TS4]GIP31607.1 hypothetical protein J2TS4_08170 [Paenibacillus sp. J2TS4]